MPLYDFLCAGCGPFEARVDAAVAGRGVGCPRCATVAARTFSVPGGRGPRRQRQLDGLSAAALRRVVRSEEGAAATGDLPPGARLDGGGRRLPGDRAPGARRPWQLGH